MILDRLTSILIRRYLLSLPLEQRLLRYGSLVSVAWLKSILIQIKPEVIPEEPDSPDVTPDTRPELIQAPTIYYRQYRCTEHDPLSCQSNCESDTPPKVSLFQSSEPKTPRCKLCYFPAWLKVEQQLSGRQGQYQITQVLGRRGLGRLYEGTHLDSEELVTIQEYLLPDRYFNPVEQKRHQERFLHLAGLSLADGRSQDMRIVAPIDAIADPSGERCYIITTAIDGSQTLNHYCARHGAFSTQMVWDLLNQALQTLVFLHQQIFTLPTGQVHKGMIHGNINLDSLLWKPNAGNYSPQGFLYFTDFALWEILFDPTEQNRDDLEAQEVMLAQDDLTALGKVAFWALNGATKGTDDHPLNPRNDGDWVNGTNPSLQHFIRRLIGIEDPFGSAESARFALLQLPLDPVIDERDDRAEELAPVKKSWLRKALPFLVIAAILAGLGTFGWLLVRSRRQALLAKPLPPPCCFKDGGVIPTGTYTYAIPASAYWRPLFQTPPIPAGIPASISAENIEPDPSSSKGEASSTGLFNQLELLQPKLSLIKRPTDSVAAAIASVQSGQADFAILPLIQPLPPDVTAITIAHDSLVPVVAFSYVERTKGLPHALNGRIRLDHLQTLYTSDADDWTLLKRLDLPLERYLPEAKLSQELIDWLVFNQPPTVLPAAPSASNVSTNPVLTNAPRGNGSSNSAQTLQTAQLPTSQNSFIPASTPSSGTNSTSLARNTLAPTTTVLPTLTMLRQILQDFENQQVGSIGLSPLSQVFGQCSVYPLALADEHKFVPPLMFDNGKPITPASDLCDRKGSYTPHGEAIRSQIYPLAYPLAIVYPFDNTRSDV
ncbi:MAG: hypothetical protein AB4042_21800, partial [Leptolyngbyaceae cyanobacterium]